MTVVGITRPILDDAKLDKSECGFRHVEIVVRCGLAPGVAWDHAHTEPGSSATLQCKLDLRSFFRHFQMLNDSILLSALRESLRAFVSESFKTKHKAAKPGTKDTKRAAGLFESRYAFSLMRPR